VLATIAAFLWTGTIAPPAPRPQDVALVPGLLSRIVLVQLIRVPCSGLAFTLVSSLAGALSVAAGIILGPQLGGGIVALAHGVDGLYVRRELIKTVVNAASNGLAALGCGLLSLTLTHPPAATAGGLPPLIAALLAAMGYLLITAGSLLPIVAPAVEVSVLEIAQGVVSAMPAKALVLALGGGGAVLVATHPIEPRLEVFALLLSPYLAALDLRPAR
jgi:hypothetical protein